MATIKKILAIANPGSVRQPACERAAAVARNLGASLRLHAVVYEPSANFDLFHIADEDHVRHNIRYQAQEFLDEIVAGISGLESVPTSTSTQWAHPFDRGVRQAVETDWPDLVMLSARDAGRLSAAEWRVLHRSEVPVWLVRDRPWPALAEIGAFVDPAHRHGARSKADFEVLNWALAVKNSAESITVLHALAKQPDEPSADIQRYVDDLIHHRREELAATVAAVTDEALNIDIKVMKSSMLMREFAARSNAALAVMGVFSRSQLGDLLIGSTARMVLPDLPCDVLAVPADR